MTVHLPKFQRQADLDVLRGSLPAGWLHPLFLAILWYFSSYASDCPRLFYTVGAVILSQSLLRLQIYRMGQTPEHAESWRRVIYGSLLISASGWGTVFAFAIGTYGYGGWPVLLLLVMMSGQAAGATSVLAARLTAQQVYLALLMGPSIAVHMWIGGSRGLAMAALYVLYTSFLFSHGRAQNRAYWSSVEDRELLEQRARELNEASQAAQAANRAKDDFLAKASHELRTPLNAIIGYGELLAEEAVAAGQTHLTADLEKIVRAGKYQLALVNDLLNLSKIEAGKMEVQTAAYDLGAVARDAVQMVRPLADRNRTSIELLLHGTDWTLEGDEMKIRQSLFNLLNNACKFTEDGTVVLDVERKSGWVTCRVIDNGIGMSADQAARIFQPFVQADPSIAAKYGGTGLGLAITRSFCELMGGRVSAESQLGKGTTLTLQIPEKVTPQAAEAPQPKFRRPAGSGESA